MFPFVFWRLYLSQRDNVNMPWHHCLYKDYLVDIETEKTSVIHIISLSPNSLSQLFLGIWSCNRAQCSNDVTAMSLNLRGPVLAIAECKTASWSTTIQPLTSGHWAVSGNSPSSLLLLDLLEFPVQPVSIGPWYFLSNCLCPSPLTVNYSDLPHWTFQVPWENFINNPQPLHSILSC